MAAFYIPHRRLIHAGFHGRSSGHAACGDRYVVSAGCEVVRDTPLENVRAMRDFARNR